MSTHLFNIVSIFTNIPKTQRSQEIKIFYKQLSEVEWILLSEGKIPELQIFKEGELTMCSNALQMCISLYSLSLPSSRRVYVKIIQV